MADPRELLKILSRGKEDSARRELHRIGDSLAPEFERLAGENGVLVVGFEPGESILISNSQIGAENGLEFDFLTVGMAEKKYPRHVVWGQPAGERVFAIRFNRVRGNEDFEPYKYRLLFRRTTEGLRFVEIDSLVEDVSVEGGREWRECELGLAYLLVTTLQDMLPRYHQRGE